MQAYLVGTGENDHLTDADVCSAMHASLENPAKDVMRANRNRVHRLFEYQTVFKDTLLKEFFLNDSPFSGLEPLQNIKMSDKMSVREYSVLIRTMSDYLTRKIIGRASEYREFLERIELIQEEDILDKKKPRPFFLFKTVT